MLPIGGRGACMGGGGAAFAAAIGNAVKRKAVSQSFFILVTSVSFLLYKAHYKLYLWRKYDGSDCLAEFLGSKF